jgi:hypothetical protein
LKNSCKNKPSFARAGAEPIGRKIDIFIFESDQHNLARPARGR